MQKQKLQVLTLPGHILYFLTALFFHISIRISCTLFICLLFNGPLKLIYFRMFCSKHSITFENMYRLNFYFQCVDIFYIKNFVILLTPHYHFHPLQRYLDINHEITAESVPLEIASSRTRTGSLWFPSASR